MLVKTYCGEIANSSLATTMSFVKIENMPTLEMKKKINFIHKTFTIELLIKVCSEFLKSLRRSRGWKFSFLSYTIVWQSSVIRIAIKDVGVQSRFPRPLIISVYNNHQHNCGRKVEIVHTVITVSPAKKAICYSWPLYCCLSVELYL